MNVEIHKILNVLGMKNYISFVIDLSAEIGSESLLEKNTAF